MSAAAMVAVVAMRRPQRPTPVEWDQAERTKGALTLTVLVKHSDGRIDRIAGEGKLRSGEEMTFGVQAAHAGRAMVIGLDAAPAATIYVPFDMTGTGVPIETGRAMALPGSIVADARTGAERVFAVLCPDDVPLDPAMLRTHAQAALARAGGHPETVVSLATTCTETSVLLHREPATR